MVRVFTLGGEFAFGLQEELDAGEVGRRIAASPFLLRESLSMSTEAAVTPDLRSEIETHKYFLSEKAGYDVGWEFAEEDYRKQFLQAKVEPAQSQTPAPKGLSGLFKRLLSRDGSTSTS